MFLIAILIVAAIFAIAWSARNRKIFPLLISIGMSIGIILAVSTVAKLFLPGVLIYLIFVSLAIFYAVAVKHLDVFSRICIIVMALSIMAYWIWILNHMHGNTLFFPIITLIMSITALFKQSRLKYELGFLVILVADAIAILLEQLFKIF